MKTIRIPGFTADISDYKTVTNYRSVVTHNDGNNEAAVIPQIRVGGVGGFGGFGGVRLGFWCEAGCSLACAACFAACVGTGPAAVACAEACTILCAACYDGC